MLAIIAFFLMVFCNSELFSEIANLSKKLKYQPATNF